MSSETAPDSRPPSGFYADINDPTLPADYFDQQLTAIREFSKVYQQEMLQGIREPDAPSTNNELYWRYLRTDFIARTHTPEGYTWQIIDRGGGLHRHLQERGAITEGSHGRVIGTGNDALERLEDALQDCYLAPELISSDGLSLDNLNEGPMLTEDLYGQPLEQDPLFEAGLTMVVQNELLFEANDRLRVPAMHQHHTFGSNTNKGFIPLVTILDTSHPVMQQTITEAYEKRIAREEQE